MTDCKQILVPGRIALAEFDQLRREHALTGFYPILLGDEEDLESILEDMEAADSAAITLNKAKEIDASRLLAERWRFTEEDSGRDEEDAAEDLTYSESWPEPHLVPQAPSIVTHLVNGTDEPLAAVVIGLFSVAEPWEVFAHLGKGGWNSYPFAAEHCAVHRYWQERYGAEVVSVTRDVVQCVVARPPMDRAGGLNPAREQFAYCDDIVSQGVATIGNLAASLVGSKTWFFWWD